MAVLAAVDIAQQLKLASSTVQVVTFNAPRVGNTAFSAWFASFGFDALRIVNQQDLTPHLPPRWTGFMHTQREIWIQDEEGATFECLGTDDAPESSECANSQRAYSMMRHLEVWGIPLGFHACLS